RVAANTSGASMSGDLRVVPYSREHAAAFRELNLDWIEEYFTVEDIDQRHLLDPEGSIIAAGGAIFIAEQDGAPVGCCALLDHGDGVYEVSKMAVQRARRGGGIGRMLLDEVIRWARAMGAVKLTITSNTVLAPAIHLYRKLGFREV